MFQSRRKANTFHVFIVASTLLALLFLFLGLLSIPFALIISGVFFVSSIFFLFLFVNRETWNIGAEGEENVAEHLKLLGSDYHVVHDVVLPGMKGNIDHVIIGAKGIFVIETKNQNGLIRCNGDSWIRQKIGRRGTRYFVNIGSPSKQVKRNAQLLNNYIQARFKTNTFVNGLVVFTNENAVLRIDNPTVAILKPHEIVNFIKNFRSRNIDGIELEELKEDLRQYSQFH